MTMKIGDLVQCWWNTGRDDSGYIYGIVVMSGPKTFTVRWESGIRNRRPQGCQKVTLVPKRLEASARAALQLGPEVKQEEFYGLGYMQGRGAS